MGLVMSDYLDKIIGGVVALIVGGISWLIRRVITNGKEIDLLKAEIEAREKRREEYHQYIRDMRDSIENARQEDRSNVEDLRQDVKEIRIDVKELFKRQQ